MGSKFKEGMYVRVSVDYENDIEPRMFAIGQIDYIDEFGNIDVIFNKDFRKQEEKIIYNYIPDSKLYPESKVQRCKLLKNTKGLYGFFDKFTIIKFKIEDKNGYYIYYVETSKGIECISESEMIVDFSRGEITPDIQMKQYEFQSPFWYGQRLLPSEILNMLNNLDENFKTLISSRAYLFQHQIDTIVRALKEDKIRLMFADEVGLGKTIEALVVLKGKRLKKALIIVPNSLINQWKNEINVKLWMKSTIYEGGVLPNKGIVLISFEKLNYINLDILINQYDFCIIDEVHKCLLNEELFNNLHKICKGISEVILLSATPIQDRKQEYLKLLKLLKPRIYDNMSETEFIIRYNKSQKIRKTVYGIIRDLEDLDEDLSEEIQEDLEDISSELEDKCLLEIVDEIEPDSETYGEEKIREALAYISENYQFEKSIIRHRRKEIENEMPKRTLKSITYEMKGGDENFYEYNTYEKVLEYANELLSKFSSKDIVGKFVTKLLNSMFSSPWALKSLLEKRNNFINGLKERTKNYADEELLLIIEKIPIINLEKEFIKRIMMYLEKWMNISKLEINNILTLIEDPDNLKGRFSLIADYIDQELYDKKVVIFTSYSETLEKLNLILNNLYDKDTIATFSYLNSKQELEENVFKFQNNEKCRIMICDESGGEGRNFQIADSIIHFDIPFSPVILEQRIGRLDRIGRDKNKYVENIVIITEDTLETDLFNLWNEGLNVFTESLSGLEIALDSINNYIISAMINDLKFGLYEILDEIKENLNQIREAVEEERYYDMSRQLDSKTKERYENVINKFDNKGGSILANTMFKWCRAIGFSPTVLETNKGKIICFDENSVNYKSMSNVMFDIPNTIEILKRKKGKKIKGTFDRGMAVSQEELVFFAPGEEIFDSIMKNVQEGYRGRCSAVTTHTSKIQWEGFVIIWNVEFNVEPLIENNLGLNYKVFSNGYMPLNQIISLIPIYEENILNGDEEEYILNYIKENYNSKYKFIHLGKRKTGKLENFKIKYKKDKWNEIVDNVVEKSRKDVLEKYNYLIQRKELDKDFKMILAGARASSRYLNNKEVNCDKFEVGLKKVKEGIINPDLFIDSILYINFEKE